MELTRSLRKLYSPLPCQVLSVVPAAPCPALFPAIAIMGGDFSHPLLLLGFSRQKPGADLYSQSFLLLGQNQGLAGIPGHYGQPTDLPDMDCF